MEMKLNNIEYPSGKALDAPCAHKVEKRHFGRDCPAKQGNFHLDGRLRNCQAIAGLLVPH
jgi:hypothetical protein